MNLGSILGGRNAFVQNGSFPLFFERLGEKSMIPVKERKSEKDNPDEIDSIIVGDCFNISSMNGFYGDLGSEVLTSKRSEFLEGKEKEAYEKAMCAFSGHWIGLVNSKPEELQKEKDKRIKFAEDALKISKNCNVAYLVFGIFKSESYEESIKYFEKAIEVTQYMQPEHTLEEIESNNDIFMVPYCRSYYRAHLGIAKCYFKLKKYKESLKYFMKLEKMQVSHKSYGVFQNYRLLIPQVYIRLNQPEKAHKYIMKNIEILDYNSVGMFWCYDLALIEYILKIKDNVNNFIKTSCIQEFINKSNDFKTYHKAGINFYRVCSMFPFCANLLNLCGVKGRKLNNVHIPTTFQITNKDHGLASAIYVYNSIESWLNVKGSIEFCYKFLNTLLLYSCVESFKYGNMNIIKFNRDQFILDNSKRGLKVCNTNDIIHLINEGIIHDLTFSPRDNYFDNGIKSLLYANKILSNKEKLKIFKSLTEKYNKKKNFQINELEEVVKFQCVGIAKMILKSFIKKNQIYNNLETIKTSILCYGNWELLQFLFRNISHNNIGVENLKLFIKTLNSKIFNCFYESKYKCSECEIIETYKKKGLNTLPFIIHDRKITNYRKCIFILKEYGGLPYQMLGANTLSDFYKSKRIIYDCLSFEGKFYCWFCKNCNLTLQNNKEEKIKLKKCARCKKAKYCSRICQKKDWYYHKKSCKKN